MIRDILKKENGVALIIALVMLLILTFIGISAISTTTYEINISGNERAGTGAFYASEGIVQLGLRKLPERGKIPQTKFGEDSFGWSGTFKDKGDPKDLQLISMEPPRRIGGGYELSSNIPDYSSSTPGKFFRIQINSTGESFGAIKEIEAKMWCGPF